MNVSKVKSKVKEDIKELKKENHNEDDIIVETNEVLVKNENISKHTVIDPLLDELDKKDKFLPTFEKSLYDFSQKQDGLSSKII